MSEWYSAPKTLKSSILKIFTFSGIVHLSVGLVQNASNGKAKVGAEGVDNHWTTDVTGADIIIAEDKSVEL